MKILPERFGRWLLRILGVRWCDDCRYRIRLQEQSYYISGRSREGLGWAEFCIPCWQKMFKNWPQELGPQDTRRAS